MPRYEFRCPDPMCPLDYFEIQAKIEDVKSLDAVCPNCGEPAIRILSTFSGKFGDTRRFHDRSPTS
jgi:hypothetical protein